MLLQLFFSVLNLVFFSVICSCTIHLGVMGIIEDKVVLLSSFMLFAVVIGIDSYRFSFNYWKTRDYFIGQLLPRVIYIGMACLTCMTFKPVVFNRIFLPLRFAGSFELPTIKSIPIVGIVFIVIVTVVRFYGARAGYLVYWKKKSEKEIYKKHFKK